MGFYARNSSLFTLITTGFNFKSRLASVKRLCVLHYSAIYMIDSLGACSPFLKF